MKKKIFGITLAVCLIVLSIASTTMAYFTDTDTKTKTFTAGNVLIELNDDVLNNVGKVFPGQTVNSTAKVTNTGSEQAYVGIIIKFNKDIEDVRNLFGWVANNSFEIIYDDNSDTVYAICPTALAVGNQIIFFDKITIPAAWNNAQMNKLDNAEISVTAYATQVYGFESSGAKTALAAAFNSAWGALVPNP